MLRAKFSVAALAAAILAMVSLTGCQPGNPMTEKVDASNPGALANWKYRHLDDLKPDQQKAFNTAIDELKLKAMAHGANGDDAIEARLDAEINGQTIGQVLQLGLGWKLARLEEQRTYLTSFLRENAKLKTRPGDTASADYLRQQRDSQTARRDQVDQQIAEVKAQMKSLGLEVKPSGMSKQAREMAEHPFASQPAPAATPGK